MNNHRKEVDKLYKFLISELNKSINELNSIKPLNEELKDIVEEFVKLLTRNINEVEIELKNLHENTSWDNLVVAFFGITNAGKSTIIETFRARFDSFREQNSDGMIVGNGTSDFTKHCQEYKLSINDKKFTLIDVPGIEGNEDEFREEITKALKKAHCIFYVNGENKKPDAAMAKKIHKYLSDWVNVYSIYNIRGGVSNYDEECERINLKTDNSNKVEEEIKTTLSDALGYVYKGNISTQGLIALCAVASFHPSLQNTLGKTQCKFLKYFGSNEAMFKFSNFEEVENLIDEKSKNYKTEILIANKGKLIGLVRKSISDIKGRINIEQDNIEKYKDALSKFETYIDSRFNNCKCKISQDLISSYYVLYDRIRGGIYSLIDKENITNDAVNRIINSELSRFNSDCVSIITNAIKKLENDILERQKEMQVLQTKIQYKNNNLLKLNLQVDGALEELKIKFSDVFSSIIDVVGFALTGALFGPIGILVGALIGGVLSIFKKTIFGDGGKGKAKNKIENELRKSYRDNLPLLEKQISILKTNIDNSRDKIINQIKDEKHNLLSFSKTINMTRISLEKFVTNLKY